METYVGLDVSQKSTAVCVIDGDGNPVWRGTVASDPQAMSLTEPLCVRHKLTAKEPLYATQTQGRSDD